MPKTNKEKSAKSPAATVVEWVIDLSILGLIVWYFSNPLNQASFKATLSSWLTKAETTIGDFEAKLKIPSSKPGTPASTQISDRSSSNAPRPPLFVPPPIPTKAQLAKEVPGDCFPPEARTTEDKAPPVAKLFFQPPPLPRSIRAREGHGKPIQFAKRKIKGVPFYQITVDLEDADAYVVIRLPNNAEQANSTNFSGGHESFESLVKRYPAAAMVNGTFFSKDEQERVMGNMVSEGKMLKYSPWENYGTTLGLLKGDYPEMVTARAEGKPNWNRHWFSLTCGPRLVKTGEIWLNPALEGFTDSHVLEVGPRSAIGFPRSRNKLYLVTFLQGLSLAEEAKLMKEMGCYEAMNLDGGASKGLSVENNIVIKPGRALTNVLVIYDSKHKAPADVITAWQHFQDNRGGATQASLY